MILEWLFRSKAERATKKILGSKKSLKGSELKDAMIQAFVAGCTYPDESVSYKEEAMTSFDLVINMLAKECIGLETLNPEERYNHDQISILLISSYDCGLVFHKGYMERILERMKEFDNSGK